MRKEIIYILWASAVMGAVSCFGGEKYITQKLPPSPKYGDIYNPDKADAFPIPNVLERLDGKGKVSTALEWERENRPQIIEYLDSEMYGRIPPRPDTMKFVLEESSDDALGGIAKRRQYKITVGGKGGERTFDVLVYIPKNAEGKVPAFICPNFSGNHTISPEKEVILPTCFLRDETYDIAKREAKRGSRLGRIPVADIVSRGFAIATFCYCDVYADKEKFDGADESIYKIFAPNSEFSKGPAIVAWAWGNMRVMDLLETLPEIDPQHIAVAGHSRLSKTALVTGAHDKRFAYVCANNGGCMGETLSKRKYGETVALMTNLLFPFWFSPNLKKYADNEGALLIDQHHLLASIAPRLLYVTSSSQDYWADPEGQLLGLINACPAFALYGAKDFPTLDALEIDNPFHGDVGYHIKSGKHNITPYDWKNFMDFAEKHGWNKKP